MHINPWIVFNIERITMSNSFSGLPVDRLVVPSIRRGSLPPAHLDFTGVRIYYEEVCRRSSPNQSRSTDMTQNVHICPISKSSCRNCALYRGRHSYVTCRDGDQAPQGRILKRVEVDWEER